MWSAERLRHSSAVAAALGALGWLAVGGAASLGAGAIHAAAIGVHSEHRQAVIAFTIVAAIQLGWGALVLVRPRRIVVALGALANAAIFGGWVLAKTSGITFIDGLGEAESPRSPTASRPVWPSSPCWPPSVSSTVGVRVR